MPPNTRRFPFVTQDTDQARLPVALLSGFLGSGKTTLVNALLRDPRMANTAVAVNEFGEIPLDQNLIDHGVDRTVVLANGCLCCNLSGDMETAVMRLFSRRENEVPPFQRLIVEPSGLSDPAPIAQAILRNPVMSRSLRLSTIVTTIDLLFAQAQLARHPESRKQIALADRLVLTKPDLAAPDARQAVSAALHPLNPTAPILTAEQGVVDPALLFPADFLDRDAIPSLPTQRSAFLAESIDPAHTTRVESLSLTADAPLRWQAFDTWLRGIRLAHADQLLRVKAMLHIAGTDGPVVVQGVHHVINAPVLLRAWPSPARQSRIVLIADPVTIAAARASWSASLPSMTAAP